MHSHLVPDPGRRATAVADFFRFDGDRIAEHWRVVQDVPETTASGHDMFSTLSTPRQLEPDPTVNRADTHAVMGKLAIELAVSKDLAAWDRYTEPPYYQHSTNTADGVETAKQVWGPVIADTSVEIMPGLSIASGDLFVTMNQAL